MKFFCTISVISNEINFILLLHKSSYGLMNTFCDCSRWIEQCLLEFYPFFYSITVIVEISFCSKNSWRIVIKRFRYKSIIVWIRIFTKVRSVNLALKMNVSFVIGIVATYEASKLRNVLNKTGFGMRRKIHVRCFIFAWRYTAKWGRTWFFSRESIFYVFCVFSDFYNSDLGSFLFFRFSSKRSFCW